MLAPRRKLWSTPSTAIDIALQFANLDVNDVVYDVGCGDGRVLIQMAALSVVLPNDKSDHHDEPNNSSEHHMIDNKESQLSSTSFTNATNYHHHCKHFVGIEISSDRANEARQNIQNAYESNQIPKHVSIQIICGNALDTTLIDYTKATVLFLYLVPRGLRLMKDIVWPDEKNLHEGEGDEGEEEEDCREKGVQSQDIEAKLASMNQETQSKDETSIQSSTKAITLIKQRRPRRIITYMSPFENTKHIRKEYCKVEHQEGAEWPVYLYHCKL